MTLAEVIVLINSDIVPNGNNEITANVLRPILIEMLQQPNDLIGDLGDLNTDSSDTLVDAINSVNNALSDVEGLVILSGQGDPNQQSFPSLSIADLYSEIDGVGSPLALWIYDGTKFIRLSDKYLSYEIPQALTVTEQLTARSNINATDRRLEELASDLTEVEQAKIRQKISAVSIDDTQASDDTTYSSNLIDQKLNLKLDLDLSNLPDDLTEEERTKIRQKISAERLNYSNIKDFGAVGDGVSDDTEPFLNALEDAKQRKTMLLLPPGEYLVSKPFGTINANGCAGITGGGVLIIDTEEEDIPVLQWIGDRELLTSGLSTSIGGDSLIFPEDLSINMGDTIFLVSNETVYNLPETRKKGQRLTVKDYNPATGDVSFLEKFIYDITDGYFYLNTYKPLVRIENVTIKSRYLTYRKGVEVVFGDLIAENLNISNFSKFCLNVSQSSAYIKSYNAVNFFTDGSNTSYGLQVSGLSNVKGYNLNLAGGRHAVAHGDVGHWSSSAVGDVNDSPLFYSSIAEYHDSYFQSDKQLAFDAHGHTYSVSVYDSEIVGGFQIGSEHSLLRNVKITNNIQIPRNTYGRDSLDISIPRGNHVLKNCEINYSGSAIVFRSSVKKIEMNEVEFKSNSTSTDLFEVLLYNAGVYSEEFEFVKIKSNAIGSLNRYFTFYTTSNLKIRDVDMYQSNLQIIHNAERHVNIDLKNINFFDNGARRLTITKSESSIYDISVNIDGLYASNSEFESIYLIRLKNALIINAKIEKESNYGLRCVGVPNIEIINSEISNLRMDSGLYRFINVKSETTIFGTSTGEWVGFYTDGDNDYKFSKPILVPDAINNEEAVNLGQLNDELDGKANTDGSNTTGGTWTIDRMDSTIIGVYLGVYTLSNSNINIPTTDALGLADGVLLMRGGSPIVIAENENPDWDGYIYRAGEPLAGYPDHAKTGNYLIESKHRFRIHKHENLDALDSGVGQVILNPYSAIEHQYFDVNISEAITVLELYIQAPERDELTGHEIRRNFYGQRISVNVNTNVNVVFTNVQGVSFPNGGQNGIYKYVWDGVWLFDGYSPNEF